MSRRIRTLSGAFAEHTQTDEFKEQYPKIAAGMANNTVATFIGNKFPNKKILVVMPTLTEGGQTLDVKIEAELKGNSYERELAVIERMLQ